MSRGVRRILGVVAAIAIPFAAPAIAGALAGSAALAGTATGAFLGTAGGSALTGAVLGGTAAAATGQNPLVGAAMGGVGGFAGAGGFQGMFGTGAQPTSTAAVSGPMGASPVPMARPAGLTLPGAAAAAPAVAAAVPAVAPVAAAAAPATLGTFFQQVGQGFLNNPAGTIQLAATVFGRSPQELTAAEQAQLEELKELAGTNRELFEQRVTEANRLLQMAEQQAPRTEQAFAETKIASERQLADTTRGRSAGEAALERRRGRIRSSTAGATAAAAEEVRGRGTQAQLMQAGLGALPTSAPKGYAGLALPTYEALQQRRDQFTRDLARAGGDLFGGIA